MVVGGSEEEGGAGMRAAMGVAVIQFGDNRLPPRFWNKVERQGDCWVWIASNNGKGYGQLCRARTRKMDYAHRLAYEALIGPIPDGLTIDHLCRNRACVNPAHMEPVTHKVNLLRGVGACAQNAHKTECVHGHPLDGGNLYVHANGWRECRVCRRRSQAECRKRGAPGAAAEPAKRPARQPRSLAAEAQGGSLRRGKETSNG
jgi:hypothetical protein